MSTFLPWQRPLREIARARQVAQILVRYGLGWLADAAGLGSFVRRARRRADHTLTTPQRMRMALEALGPTFIKLGQMLSTRPDLLPPEYIDEFQKLLDAAPAIPSQVIIARIEAELESPLSELYAWFDPEPLAAASIGQVHRARLLDGTPVVVKVRRPGVARLVNDDLDLLARQARVLERGSSLARDYRVSELVAEFAYGLRQELDYLNEGRNADRFRKTLADDPRVKVPLIFWELSTSRVLTMEEIEGIKFSDIEALRAAGYDLVRIAREGTEIYLRQIFENGFFHADPHPGNLFMTRQDQYAFVDFGLVGTLTPTAKNDLVDLFLALIDGDPTVVTQSVLDMGAAPDTVDRRRLDRDAARLLTRYYDTPLEQVKLSELLNEVFALAFRHRLRLPAELVTLARTLILLEGLAVSLDPNFVLVEAARPFARRLVAQRLAPRALVREGLRTAHDLSGVLRSLPRRVGIILDRLERGELQVEIRQQSLDRLAESSDRLINRVVVALVLSALILGSSLMIAFPGTGFSLFGFTLPVAQITFVVTVLLSLLLVFVILWRRGL